MVDRGLTLGDADVAVLKRGHTDRTAVKLAHQLWSEYPGIFRHHDCDNRHRSGSAQSAFDIVQRLSIMSADLLVTAAESFNIDGGPIWASAALCRELFEHGGAGLDHADVWPECLGPSRRQSLNTVDQQTVVDGSATLSRVRARIALNGETQEGLKWKGYKLFLNGKPLHQFQRRGNSTQIPVLDALEKAAWGPARTGLSDLQNENAVKELNKKFRRVLRFQYNRKIRRVSCSVL